MKEFPDKIHQLGIALEVRITHYCVVFRSFVLILRKHSQGDLFDIKTLSLIVEGTDIPAFSALENKQNSVSDQVSEYY